MNCRVCRSASLDRLFPCRDLLHGTPGEYGVYRCRACGFRQTHPTRLDVYPEDYGPHSGAPGVARAESRTIAHWIPPLEPGSRVLELGPGRGDFLRLLARLGCRTSGVETNPRAAEKAREGGADVREAIDGFGPASFDAVFAWMVLEHLEDPRAGVEGVARVLRPGGWFVFSVPNASSWEYSFFRDRWYALDCPRHLTHFTEDGLRRLLRDAGFAVRAWFHQRNSYNVLASLGYLLGSRRLVDLPERAGRLVQAALFPVASVLAAIRQGGRLTVAARRR